MRTLDFKVSFLFFFGNFFSEKKVCFLFSFLQALSEHLSSFCSARSRSVADVLTEAVRSFSKFVKDDEGAQSDSEGGSDADEEEREINGWVNEEPVKKAKQTPADHVDASIFNMPSIARLVCLLPLVFSFYLVSFFL